MAELKQNAKGQTDDFMRIQDLIYLCLAKWKWFILSLFVTLSVAVAYILCTPPVYTRSASILIKEDSKGNSMSSEFANFADMGLFQTNTNVNNELLALQSPDIMYEVVKRLHLDINYYLPGKFHDEVAYGTTLPVNVSIQGLPENDAVSFNMEISAEGELLLSNFIVKDEHIADVEIRGKLSDTLQTPAGKIIVVPSPYYANVDYSIKVVRGGLYSVVNNYSSNLTVALVDDKASVISLSVKDLSVQRAEEILNTLISIYNENWVKDKNQVAVSTSMFINERLAVIENELGSVDEDISSYKSENLLPDVQAASAMYMTESSQTSAQLMTLNNQLYMTRYVRNYLANEANKNQLLPSNSGIDNNSIETYISEYNTKLLQRNSLVSSSSTENPLVIDMDEALADMRQAIVVSIDNQMTALNNQISSLQKNEQQTTANIAANPTQAQYLLSVERQQKVKESLYLFLLQKREENELSQAFTAYNTRIITPPYGSMLPIAPVRRNILLIALVVGFLIPIIVVFMRESMNTKIRGRKDLNNISIPFIGEIPYFVSKKRGLFSKRQQKQRAIVVQEGSRDIINEAFRVLRTNLEFMTEKKDNSNVIIVTSFNPGSGKSFLSMNIAISLAIKHKKVLVIDGDLRQASSSAYVGSPKLGLSDYLSSRVENLETIIVADKKYENLHILPVGTIPPNPTELLFDYKLKQIIDSLRNRYDYIFIDCPPIEIVADTQILEKLADRTIFIVRAGLFEKAMLTDLEQLYTEKRYKNMSLILNATEGGGNGKYGHRYGYRYGYHYGYGSGYGYGSSKANNTT